MSVTFHVIALGVGATLIVDLWAWLRLRIFHIQQPDYALVGRWFGHMPHGRFRHQRIGASTPIRGELIIGWMMHYLIGIAFAALLIGFTGPTWLHTPKLLPALTLGVTSVAAPFVLMQPALGAGLAARATPQPGRARAHSLATHAIFGIGLYLTALALKTLS